MNIVSANVNGLRSALQNGFFALNHVQNADVLCLQETRCDDAAMIGGELDYHVVAADRVAHGDGDAAPHGGVAIFSRQPLETFGSPVADALRDRGQYVAARIDGVHIASAFVSLDARPEQFAAFTEHFRELRADDAAALVCGDMNTFRDERDSWSFANAFEKRAYGCDEHAMAWFSSVFEAGWIDAVERDWVPRPLYTWWARSALFDRGDGTRLDYILASERAFARMVPESSRVMMEHRFGGHAQLALSLK
jgi:exodeoxyribonuclease-3